MTQITLDDRGDEIVVSFPFDRDAVDRLKATVPSFARRFDPTTKRWHVESRWGEALTEALLADGHDVGAVPGEPPPPEASEPGSLWAPGADKEWAKAKAAEIFDSIPAHLRSRTFRELAKLVFPDLYRS